MPMSTDVHEKEEAWGADQTAAPRQEVRRDVATATVISHAVIEGRIRQGSNNVEDISEDRPEAIMGQDSTVHMGATGTTTRQDSLRTAIRSEVGHAVRTAQWTSVLIGSRHHLQVPQPMPHEMRALTA